MGLDPRPWRGSGLLCRLYLNRNRYRYNPSYHYRYLEDHRSIYTSISIILDIDVNIVWFMWWGRIFMVKGVFCRVAPFRSGEFPVVIWHVRGPFAFHIFKLTCNWPVTWSAWAGRAWQVSSFSLQVSHGRFKKHGAHWISKTTDSSRWISETTDSSRPWRNEYSRIVRIN